MKKLSFPPVLSTPRRERERRDISRSRKREREGEGAVLIFLKRAAFLIRAIVSRPVW